MKAKAIIGAGLGDEGKGLITDYFSNKDKSQCLVIRFNGGGQAAHTVVTPEGKKHIFHHVGSGTFNRAATMLSRFFIVNPLVFVEEFTALSNMGYKPRVYVSPDAIVTTPYDMYLNNFAEQKRGDEKHGSCGLGINETVTRCEKEEYCIKVIDLLSIDIHEKLNLIREQYFPMRCEELGIKVDDKIIEVINNTDAYDGAIRLYKTFTMLADIFDECDVIGHYSNVLFEGAQGLLLDEEHEWFPHVTRSKTGLHNVMIIARECGINVVNPVFVTRCYATRHGEGPLPNELDKIPYSKVSDPTNRYNPHQGNLRYGYLDISLLTKTINDELNRFNGVGTNTIAITCLDQVDEEVKFYQNGSMFSLPDNAFIKKLERNLNMSSISSYGRTRETIIGSP